MRLNTLACVHLVFVAKNQTHKLKLMLLERCPGKLLHILLE